MQEVEFFKNEHCPLTLLDVKPKLNQQADRRIRLDFSMALTANILKSAPQDVQDAFYAISKEDSHMNPIGISTEFEGVIANFYATEKTKHASLELANCTLKQLEVARPENKAVLADGDVRLSFHMNIPASMEAWQWSYRAYATDFSAVFEAMQPVFPQIKAANPNGDGQGILNMEKQDTQSTIATKTQTGFNEVDREEAAVSRVKPAKSKKKAKAKK